MYLSWQAQLHSVLIFQFFVPSARSRIKIDPNLLFHFSLFENVLDEMYDESTLDDLHFSPSFLYLCPKWIQIYFQRNKSTYANASAQTSARGRITSRPTQCVDVSPIETRVVYRYPPPPPTHLRVLQRTFALSGALNHVLSAHSDNIVYGIWQYLFQVTGPFGSLRCIFGYILDNGPKIGQENMIFIRAAKLVVARSAKMPLSFPITLH